MQGCSADIMFAGVWLELNSGYHLPVASLYCFYIGIQGAGSTLLEVALPLRFSTNFYQTVGKDYLRPDTLSLGNTAVSDGESSVYLDWLLQDWRLRKRELHPY